MNDFPAAAQETAAEYMNEGLWQDGADVLTLSTSLAPDKSRIHAMAYYYLGYFEDKLGEHPKASECFDLAMSMPTDYVFPFQNEAIDVLHDAIANNPRDARAHYYLGNLLYDWQPEEATRMWKASETLDPSFAIVHRNLAAAYMHQASGADLRGAIAELEQAVSVEPRYALHFTELDELYEQAGVPLDRRLNLFKQNASIVMRRDDALNRYLALQIATGDLDDAIQTMTTHAFAVAEGENLNVADHWSDAHILRAQREIRAKHYAEALTDLKAAAKVPANLPISSDSGSFNVRAPEIDYWTGVAYHGLGDKQKAAESWRQAIAARGRRDSRMGEATAGERAQGYFQGLAFERLGQEEKAQELFQELVRSGERELKDAAMPAEQGEKRQESGLSPRSSSANASYLAGLGYLGLKDWASAKDRLKQAVQMSPDLLGARIALANNP